MNKLNFTAYNPTELIKPITAKRRWINIQTIVAFIAGIVISLLVYLGIVLFNSSSQYAAGEPIDYETALDLSAYVENLDSSWTIKSADPSISDIIIDSTTGLSGNIMVLHFYRTGANDFTFTGPNGESLNFTISIDKNNNIEIYRR